MKLGISKGYNNFLHIMRKQRMRKKERERERIRMRKECEEEIKGD